MNGLIQHKNIILKIAILILFFQTILLADITSISESSYTNSELINERTALKSIGSSEEVEVSLDSFGGMSVMIVLILTSLLGAFFVRDEFPSAFK